MTDRLDELERQGRIFGLDPEESAELVREVRRLRAKVETLERERDEAARKALALEA